MLLRQTTDRNTANRLLLGSFVLALLCSCSSAETDASNSSVTTSAGSIDTGANTGPSGTQGGTGTTGTPTGAGPSGTQTSTGAGNAGPSGTQTSTGASGAGPSGTQTVTGAGGAGPSGTQTGTASGTQGGAGGGDTSVGTGGAQTDVGAGGSETTGGGETTTGSGGTDTGPDDGTIVFLAGDNVNANGPLDTVQENLSFSGGGHILVRPADITSEPNTKHPVAIWGPGGGTAPDYYLTLLTRMASQGFVIVGIRESTGDSVLMSAAIDWLEEQNGDSSSPMYDRLILDRVGVFGHSMGGLSSEAAALADDRVSTALLDNSGSFSHDALVSLTIPVGIIYGETGQERPNAEGDFNNPANQGPCWMSMMSGGGHGSGPWDGAGANVAWMRWHLGGENFRKDEFIGAGGDYNDGIWVTEFKNWEDWKNWNE